ncbi:hypothetical protein EJB05_44038, partial [Eragrostis curvula]
MQKDSRERDQRETKRWISYGRTGEGIWREKEMKGLAVSKRTSRHPSTHPSAATTLEAKAETRRDVSDDGGVGPVHHDAVLFQSAKATHRIANRRLFTPVVCAVALAGTAPPPPRYTPGNVAHLQPKVLQLSSLAMTSFFGAAYG